MNEVISRRSFMAAAGAAGLFPSDVSRPSELTDDERLNACIVEIRAILKRKHPVVHIVHENLATHEDGTFLLSIQGERRYEKYSGEGIYEIVIGRGTIAVYWLQRDVQRRMSDGSPIPGGELYWGRRIIEGKFIDDKPTTVGWPRIVRKLENWEQGGATG
ncbi:MAG: hypothetical protein BGO06_00615 [Shinella sp. 65-6]|nr:hypothetical protein [Hyphomicrobiales bacterium]OJU85931.1 MAG: hypothetical protein BGO06_00615 [Shinella sp. 65-6]